MKAKKFNHSLVLGISLLPALMLGCKSHTEEKQKPKLNVLFIAVDDLRPELGCYGSKIAITPNMDDLARQGVLFERAYCSQSLCCPARTSLLTSVRPETDGIVDNYTNFRDVIPNVITLPQLFRENGYMTTYIGKVFQPQFPDRKLSWSNEPVKIAQKKPNQGDGGYVLPENVRKFKALREEMAKKYGKNPYFGLGRGPAFEAADVSDNAYEDGYDADVAVATMRELSKQNKPFFLAVGFHKPHLDFVAPKKYWDLYDEAKIPITTQTEEPRNAAKMGLTPDIEVRDRYGIPKMGSINQDTLLAKKLKHGYLACVSYIDAQVGKLLKKLDELGIRDNTIIVIWGDQGYHLGEMGLWAKATNYEYGTRVPIIVSAPYIPQKNRGGHINALVEQVDIYPTLCDLAGISKPVDQLEGYSFKPLLVNPDMPWKKAVFSMYPTPALREWGGRVLRPDMYKEYFVPLMNKVVEGIKNQMGNQWDRELFEKYLIGYAMRTDRYRIVLWKDSREPQKKPLFIELYDHQTDPFETVNIAFEQSVLVNKLMEQFNKGWRGNLPVLSN